MAVLNAEQYTAMPGASTAAVAQCRRFKMRSGSLHSLFTPTRLKTPLRMFMGTFLRQKARRRCTATLCCRPAMLTQYKMMPRPTSFPSLCWETSSLDQLCVITLCCDTCILLGPECELCVLLQAVLVGSHACWRAYGSIPHGCKLCELPVACRI